MRLKPEEKAKLIEASKRLTKEDNIQSLAAYGSKVAGYARPESDYDAILVLKKYPEIIRYRYISDPLNASFIVVSGDALLQDAMSSYLGEFVAGRFLNIYEPIINPELLKKAEVSYKKRVILEELYELSTEYGEFLEELIIPYDYFLFSKLKKRAKMYPPALFSYVSTYTCALAKENKEATLRGFREAAKELEHSGYVKADISSIKIGSGIRADPLGRIFSLFSLATRGLTHYAVHGYAGRVGFNIVREEAASKIRRIRKIQEIPDELDEPRNLLVLDYGFLAHGSDIVDFLAKKFGLGSYKREERSIGEIYSTTSVLSLSDSVGTILNFIVKRFSDVRAIKWVLLGLWAAASRKFSMSPLGRMHREYKASKILINHGISVPRIIAVSIESRAIVKEYIEGVTLSKYIKECEKKGLEPIYVKEYGKLLAKAHSVSVAIGDTKPENVLLSNGSLYLTDLEQATENGDYSWDIAEFLFYTSKLTLNQKKIKKLSSLFLEGYLETGEEEVVKKAFQNKYVSPFRPFISPKTVPIIRSSLEEILKIRSCKS